MNIISFFAGAGGLDLGFEMAGFNVEWACEYDKNIWATYRANHPNTYLETRSITLVKPEDLPSNICGIIGGPPCQSWSLAGSMRGIDDPRGQLFYDYLRLLEAKHPSFFVAENVPGMLSPTHIDEFLKIKSKFEECGYNVNYSLLNAWDYGAAQDRKRVILVGYRKDLNLKFDFNKLKQVNKKLVSKDIISDLPKPLPALEKNRANEDTGEFSNNEYFIGDFSSIFMSRNRIRTWDEPSFTIQASGRQAPIHPASDPMIKLDKNKWEFTGSNYRRLSVRECARIQGFPDTFKFIYDRVDIGYKMIGNAVPIPLANVIASQIMKDLKTLNLSEVAITEQ